MSEEVHRGKAVWLPVLGQKAPDFEAQTTHGVLRLSDFKGSWLVLFSHPADFTPCARRSLWAFAQLYEEFNKRNIELLGLSFDSVFSHIAWVRNIEEKMEVKIPFQIIADLNKEVAKKWHDPSGRKNKGYALLSANHWKKYEGDTAYNRRTANNGQI